MKSAYVCLYNVRRFSDPAVVPENGCATLSLEALKSGDTKVMAEWKGSGTSLKAEIRVSAFEPLKVSLIRMMKVSY